MPKDEQAQERTDFGMSKVVYIIVPIEYVIAERDIFNLRKKFFYDGYPTPVYIKTVID